MKRYALMGACSRGLGMYGKAIAGRYRDSAQLVGIYGINPVRAHYVGRECENAPVFSAFADQETSS